MGSKSIFYNPTFKLLLSSLLRHTVFFVCLMLLDSPYVRSSSLTKSCMSAPCSGWCRSLLHVAGLRKSSHSNESQLFSYLSDWCDNIWAIWPRITSPYTIICAMAWGQWFGFYIQLSIHLSRINWAKTWWRDFKLCNQRSLIYCFRSWLLSSRSMRSNNALFHNHERWGQRWVLVEGCNNDHKYWDTCEQKGYTNFSYP